MADILKNGYLRLRLESSQIWAEWFKIPCIERYVQCMYSFRPPKLISWSFSSTTYTYLVTKYEQTILACWNNITVLRPGEFMGHGYVTVQCMYSVVQRLTAVTAHFTIEKLLLFVFVLQFSYIIHRQTIHIYIVHMTVSTLVLRHSLPTTLM